LILSEECTFTGNGKLVERPLDVYYKIFEEQKIKYKTNNGTFTASGHSYNYNIFIHTDLLLKYI